MVMDQFIFMSGNEEKNIDFQKLVGETILRIKEEKKPNKKNNLI
jgi:hypothetical protein